MLKHFLLTFNMEDGRGIFWKKNRGCEGQLAFVLKDDIDGTLVGEFQTSGELDGRFDRIE